jgi:hypothetical protein
MSGVPRVFAWKESGTALIQIGPEIVRPFVKQRPLEQFVSGPLLYRAGAKLPRQLTCDRLGLKLASINLPLLEERSGPIAYQSVLHPENRLTALESGSASLPG